MCAMKLEAEVVEHYLSLTTFTVQFVSFLLLSQQKHKITAISEQ